MIMLGFFRTHCEEIRRNQYKIPALVQRMANTSIMVATLAVMLAIYVINVSLAPKRPNSDRYMERL